MRAPDSEYDPRRWHSGTMKRRRRQTSTKWILLLGLVMVMVWPAIEILKPAGGHSAAPLFLLLTVGATMSPFAREAYLTGKGFATFDEFERAALLMALRRSYLISILLVGATFGWLAVGYRLGWSTPHTLRQWVAVGSTVTLVMLALPTLIAEWTVPMPDEEDEPL